MHFRKRLVDHPTSTEDQERDCERNLACEQEWAKEASNLDPRSWLEHFRMPQNKAFATTRLVSLAWCELQHS